jgi:hypothetical protein
LEKTGIRRAPVLDVLSVIGAEGLTEHEAERLVRNLMDDGLITESDSLVFDLSNESVGLTGPGRYEVEQWLAEPDKPTDAIPVPANQIKIKNMNVTGPALLGSTANNVTTTYGTSGAELIELVTKFRQLLAGTEVSPDDREAIEADLEVIEEEAGATQPRWARLRPFLRRLRGVIEKGALAGIEAGAKQEVIHLIEQAQQLPGISG